uniref:Kinesin motor domain-containing protein n=1 Tax=Odontella aurita TaxID=265563 RepID=A0A7S4K3M1_9STRA
MTRYGTGGKASGGDCNSGASATTAPPLRTSPPSSPSRPGSGVAVITIRETKDEDESEAALDAITRDHTKIIEKEEGPSSSLSGGGLSLLLRKISQRPRRRSVEVGDSDKALMKMKSVGPVVAGETRKKHLSPSLLLCFRSTSAPVAAASSSAASSTEELSMASTSSISKDNGTKHTADTPSTAAMSSIASSSITELPRLREGAREDIETGAASRACQAAGVVASAGEDSDARCAWDIDTASSTVRLRSQLPSSKDEATTRRNLLEGKTFRFDAVRGPSDKTRSLYTSEVRPLVRSTILPVTESKRAARGGRARSSRGGCYDALILCHGAPGSGRTRSVMTGVPSDPGVVPLAVTDLFRFIKKSEESLLTAAGQSPRRGASRRSRPRRRVDGASGGGCWRCKVRVSYLEVRGEKVRDLLAVEPTTATGDACRASVNRVPGTDPVVAKERVEHRRRGRVSPAEIECSSAEEVFRSLARGTLRRRGGTKGGANYGDDEENATTARLWLGRAHTVVRLIVERHPRRRGSGDSSSQETKPPAGAGSTTTTTTLTLVDLGGNAETDEGLRNLEDLVRTLSRPPSAAGGDRRRSSAISSEGSSSNLASASPACVAKFMDGGARRTSSGETLGEDDASVATAEAEADSSESSSELVRLLCPALSPRGPARVCVICALSPLVLGSDDFDTEAEATLRTLEFARRARAVPLRPVPKYTAEEERERSSLRELRAVRGEVESLRTRLEEAERNARVLRTVHEEERCVGLAEVTRLRRELEREKRRRGRGRGIGDTGDDGWVNFSHSDFDRCAADEDGEEDFVTAAQLVALSAFGSAPLASASESVSFRGGADVPGGVDGVSCPEESVLRDAVRSLDRVIRNVVATQSLSSSVRRSMPGQLCQAPERNTDADPRERGGASEDDDDSSSLIAGWDAVGASGALLRGEEDDDATLSVISSVSSGSFRTALGSHAAASFRTAMGDSRSEHGWGAALHPARVGECGVGDDSSRAKGRDDSSPDYVVASWESLPRSGKARQEDPAHADPPRARASFEFDDACSAVSSLTGATTMLLGGEVVEDKGVAASTSALAADLYQIQRMLCVALEKEERRRRQQNCCESNDAEEGTRGPGIEWSASLRGVARRSEIISRLLEKSQEESAGFAEPV